MKILKLYTLILSIIFVTNCNTAERKENLRNFSKVSIGDNYIEVISKMGSEPDEVVYGDSIYLYQQQVDSLINFIYFTPWIASNATIYFKNCEVLYMHVD